MSRTSLLKCDTISLSDASEPEGSCATYILTNLMGVKCNSIPSFHENASVWQDPSALQSRLRVGDSVLQVHGQWQCQECLAGAGFRLAAGQEHRGGLDHRVRH